MKKQTRRRVLPIAVTLCLLSSTSVFALASKYNKGSQPAAAHPASAAGNTQTRGAENLPALSADVFHQANREVSRLIQAARPIAPSQVPTAAQPAAKVSWLPSIHIAPVATPAPDTTKPSIWFYSPSNEQAVGADGTISIGAFDDVSLRDIQLTVVGRNYSKTVSGIDNKNGSLSVSVKDLGLPDGFYTLRAVATDTAGNVSVTADRNFKIDTTAPVLTSVTYGSTAVKDGVILKGSDTFTANFDELNPQRTYVEVDELVNGKWQKVQGQWSTDAAAKSATLPVDTTKLKSYTQYQLKISTDDAAGNHAGAAYAFTVDNIQPSVWFGSPSDQQVMGADGTISVGAHDDVSLSTIKLTVAGQNYSKTVSGLTAPDGSLSVSVKDLGLPDGFYTLRAVATDTAGNVSVAGERNFIIDATAPVLTSVTYGSTSVKDGIVLKGADTFTAKFDEEHPQRTYVEVDELVNGKWQKVQGQQSTDAAAKSATLPVDTTKLKPYTQYQLKISSDDALWNHSGAAYTFTVDNTRPSVWFNTPSNEQALKADGIVSVGAFDDVSLNNIKLTVVGRNYSKTVSGIADKNGSLSVSVKDLGLPDGFYTLRAVATDTAGNESVTADRNFKVDTTAPALTSVTFGSTAVKNGVVLKGSDVFTANFAELNPQRTYVEVDALVNGKWQKVQGQWSTGAAANAATLPFDISTLDPSTQYQLKISSDDAAWNHTGAAFSFTVESPNLR